MPNLNKTMEPNISDTTAGTEPVAQPSQTPLDLELEKEERRSGGRTEAEKAAYSLKKNAERMRELGIDPAVVLGYSTDNSAPVVDKEAPLTIGEYEKMQKEQSQMTALQIAQKITDPKERELTIKYLQTRIIPSGDAEDDVRFARQAVNSVKNGLIVEEMQRATEARTYSSGAGAPANPTPKIPELTPSELLFTKKPFNLTVEQIIAQRTQS